VTLPSCRVRCHHLVGLRLVVPAVSAMLGIAACASPGGGAHAVVSGPVSSVEMSVLLDSGPSEAAQDQLNYAMDVLTQRCMRAKNFLYYPEPLGTIASVPAGATEVPEFPVYTSLADRKVNGYGDYASAEQELASGHNPSSHTPSDEGSSEEADYVSTLSAEAQQRYADAQVGPPGDTLSFTLPGGQRGTIVAGGCRGTAAKELFGSMANYIQATQGANQLYNLLLADVEGNAAFVAAVNAWSSCMADRGYKYQSPTSAYNEIQDQYAADGPTAHLRQLEIKVAVNDYQCAEKVSLLRTTVRLNEQDARQLGPQIEGDLLRITEMDASAVVRASRLVPGS
jgi:hypothetical protein